MSLNGKVALVTGATRGAGRGIARVLGEHGATVYVTGRSSGGESPTGRSGTIEEAAAEVNARGGHGIAVRCDHSDDAQVAALVDEVRRTSGRLDILVSNAWGSYELNMDDKPIWELDPEHLDLMITAGLRAHIIMTQFAAPLLRETRDGLVVITTWRIGAARKPRADGQPGYHRHFYYDVIKTAINRIPVGITEDLRPYGVTALAVSPGPMHDVAVDTTSDWAQITESTEFVGRAIAALAHDPDVQRHAGTLKTVVDLAADYGFTDLDGTQISKKWESYFAAAAAERSAWHATD